MGRELFSVSVGLVFALKKKKKILFFVHYLSAPTPGLSISNKHTQPPPTILLLSREFHNVPITSAHVVPSKLWTEVK